MDWCHSPQVGRPNCTLLSCRNPSPEGECPVFQKYLLRKLYLQEHPCTEHCLEEVVCQHQSSYLVRVPILHVPGNDHKVNQMLEMGIPNSRRFICSFQAFFCLMVKLIVHLYILMFNKSPTKNQFFIQKTIATLKYNLQV